MDILAQQADAATQNAATNVRQANAYQQFVDQAGIGLPVDAGYISPIEQFQTGTVAAHNVVAKTPAWGKYLDSEGRVKPLASIWFADKDDYNKFAAAVEAEKKNVAGAQRTGVERWTAPPPGAQRTPPPNTNVPPAAPIRLRRPQ